MTYICQQLKLFTSAECTIKKITACNTYKFPAIQCSWPITYTKWSYRTILSTLVCQCSYDKNIFIPAKNKETVLPPCLLKNFLLLLYAKLREKFRRTIHEWPQIHIIAVVSCELQHSRTMYFKNHECVLRWSVCQYEF